MSTKIINRRSKVGFGYNAGAVQGEHGLYVPLPERPDYIGTVRTVSNSLEKDRTLASFRSGGTIYSCAWFVKKDGKWHRIKSEQAYQPGDLLIKVNKFYPGDDEYFMDELELEIED